MMPPVSLPATSPDRWQIVVPVRGGLVGKSRLHSIEGQPLSETDRMELAAAMAADTVSAALAADVGPVAVLTADPAVVEAVTDLGARTLPDHGTGLNAELEGALAQVPSSWGAIALLGDLPALRPPDLRAAVGQVAAAGRAYVLDWEETGTTLVGYAPGETERHLAFGPASGARHAGLGLAPIGAALERLRCDVDTPQAWQRAMALGTGPATAAARERILARPEA